MARRVGFGDKDRNETRRDAERWDRPSREGRAERKERLERERAERRARSEAAQERPTTGESAVGRARGSRGGNQPRQGSGANPFLDILRGGGGGGGGR